MNILISTVGRRNYIVEYFKAVLKDDGKVITTNSIADSAGMYAADSSYISPPIVSSLYIPFLLDICKKEKISAILPLFDMDLSAIAFNKNKFIEAGVFPIVSDYSAIETCFDKFKYPELLKTINILTPKTFTSLDEALEEIEIENIKFPLVLKPRWGTGSVSTSVVNDKQDLIYQYNKLSLGLSETFLESPVPEGYINQMIIQEFITGDEYGMDIINDLSGNYIQTFVKKKLGMRSGETDGAITIKNKDYELIGYKIANMLKHIAILDVDFILTPESEVYIIDMNPRFGGGYPFTHQAGVNLPAAIIDWLSNKISSQDYFIMEPDILSVKGISLLSKNWK
jgi:carbamoyl-phosphate synthase large subunit